MDQQRVDEEHRLIHRAGKELAQDNEQEGDGEEQTQVEKSFSVVQVAHFAK